MKNLFCSKAGLGVCLIELVIGIILLFRPVGFTNAIIVTVGVMLCLKAIKNIVDYFRAKPADASQDSLLTRGLLTLLAGLFCTFNSEWFIAAFPMITMLYGIFLLMLGMGKIQWMIDLLRLKDKKWFWAAIAAALTIIPALLIILNPFSSTAFLWTFVAVSLIVDAVMDTVSLFMTRKA